jgi:hypothetical protein
MKSGSFSPTVEILRVLLFRLEQRTDLDQSSSSTTTLKDAILRRIDEAESAPPSVHPATSSWKTQLSPWRRRILCWKPLLRISGLLAPSNTRDAGKHEAQRPALF